MVPCAEYGLADGSEGDFAPLAILTLARDCGSFPGNRDREKLVTEVLGHVTGERAYALRCVRVHLGGGHVHQYR